MNLAENFKKNITGVQHVGIPTPDLNKTIEFYHSLGFEIVWQKEGEVAFMQLGTLVVEVYPTDDAAMANGAIDHVALNVTDIEAVWRDVHACGYEVVDKEINFLPFFDKGVQYFTIIGPSREKVEFNHYV